MAKQLNVNLAFTADTSKAKAQLQDLQRSLDSLMKGSTNSANLPLTKELLEAQNAAASLKVALDSAINTQTGKLDITKFSGAMKTAGLDATTLRKHLENLGPAGDQAFLSLTKSVMSAEMPVRRTNALIAEMWTTLKNTARWQISSSILHGFMGTVQSAYGYTQDLNESLNNIRIVTGQNVEEMARFADKANKAAKALSTTTTEYTNASLIYYQQGLSESEVEARTNITIKMANAAGVSAQTVSDQLTAVWNNFYDGSKSLEYYADVMTALGAATASSTDEISEGLNKFAAVAETVGLSYEYATSALATVTATTRESADVVGTAFKTLFARIQGLTLGETLEDGTDLNKYSDALNKVGINIKDTNGQMKDMDSILDELGSKWQTLGKDQQTALAQTVAGVRQYTQLVALMDNWDYFQENLGVAQGAEGTLQKQADIYAESWEAARDRVAAAAEDLYDSILDDDFFITLLNGFEKAISLVTNLVDSLGGLPGILSVVATLVTKIFSKQLETSIDNMVYDFNSLSGANLKNSKETKEEYAKEAEKISFNDASDEGAAIGVGMQQQTALQKELLANESKLSEAEKQRIQNLMDIHQLYVDQAAAAGKAADAARKVVQEQNKEARLKVKRSEKDGASIDTKEFTKARTEMSAIIKDGRKAQKAIELLGEGFEKIEKSPNAFNKQIELVQQRLDSINTDSGTAKTFRNLTEQFQTGKITAEQFKQELQKLAQSGEVVDDAVIAASDAFLKFRDAGVLSVQETDAMANAELDLQNKTASANNALNAQTQQANNIKIAIAGAKGAMDTFAQSVVKVMQGVSQIGMGISSLVSIFDVLNNQDMSFGEKLLSITMSLSMAIPALIGGLQALNREQLKRIKADAVQIGQGAIALIQSGLRALGAWGEATANKGVTASLWEQVAAWVAVHIASLPVSVVILLIVAALGALIAISAGVIAAFDAISNAYNADAIAAENAATAAQNLAEAYNEVKQEYEDMISAMENYQSARDALDNLTKGTEEYRQALKEANRQALELINQYGLIEGQDYEWEGDELVIKDSAKSRVRSEKEDEMDKAYAASQMANAEAKRTQAIADQTALRREMRDDVGLGDGDKIWGSIANGVIAGLGAVLAPVTGGLSLLATGAAFVNQGLMEEKSQAYNAAIDKAIEEGKTNANLFDTKEAMAEALELDDQDIIDALWANKDSLEQLSADMNAAAEAEKLAAQNAANEIMSESGYDKSEAGKMALEAGGEIYQQMYGDAYDKYLADAKDRGLFNTGTDASKAAFEEYAKQSGLDQLKNFKVTNYKGDGTVEYKYIDEQGQEQTALATAEEIAATLAAAEAANSLEGALSGLRDTIADLNKSENLGDHALAEFLSKGNLEGATKAEYDKLYSDIGAGKDSEGNLTYDSEKLNSVLGLTGDTAADLELAKSRGYESAEAYKEAFIKSLNIEWEVPKDIGEDISGNLTVGAANKIQSTFEEMGAEGGQAFVDTINHIASGADWEALAPEEQTAMLDEIANIDWSSWDAGEQAIAIAERYGIAIDGTNEAWQLWINTMRDASNALPDLKALSTDMKQLGEISSNIDLGSIISSEDYDLLTKYNQALGDYFTILSDGSAQFIGDKLDFQQAVEETQQQELENAITQYMDRLGEIQAQQEAGANAVGGAENLDSYRDSENFVGDDGKNYYKGANVNTQLDFLESQGYDQEQLDTWKLDLEDGSTTVNVLEDIAAAVDETATAYNNLGTEADSIRGAIQTAMNEIALGADNAAERMELLEEGTINVAAYGQAALAAINKEKWGDFDTKEVKNYAKHLMDVAESSEILSDELKNNEEAAEDVALYIKKMNEGVEKLSKGFDDWSDILKESDESSEEYAEAITGMKDAVSDLLGTSEEFISNDFLTSHLEDIGKAAEGDAEAIDRLKIALSEDILCNILVVDNFEDINSDIQDLHNQIIGFDAGIQVGATLETGDFATAAQGIIDAAGMTVEQAQAYFNSLGYEPEFVMQNETRTAPMYGKRVYTDNPVIDYVPDGKGGEYPYIKEMTTHEEQVYMGEQEQNFVVPALSANGTPQIKSLNKVSKGSFNNGSGSNKGGNKSGGGGGGGSKPKKATPTKKSDIVQRYKETEDRLDDIREEADRTRESLDRLYGAEHEAAIQRLLELEQQEIDLLKEKEQEARNYLQEDLKELKKVSAEVDVEFKFDDNNNIENYEEEMTKLYEELAEIQRKAGDEWDENEQKEIDALNEKIKKLEEAMAAYEETRELLEDINAELDTFKGKPALPLITSDTLDIYWEINDALDDIDEKIKDLERQAEGLSGEEKLKVLEEINRLEQERVAILQQQAEVNQKDIEEKRAALDELARLNGLQFEYDEETGNITNYLEQMGILQAQLDELHAKKAADGLSPAEEEAMNAIIAKMEELADLAGDYRDAVEESEDISNEIEDTLSGIVADPFVRSDFVDIFKETNDQLDDIDRKISKLQNEADKLTGEARRKKLNEIVTLERKRVEILEHQALIAKTEMEDRKRAMEEIAARQELMFEYDENQNITNYQEQLDILIDKYEKAYNEALGDDGLIDATEQAILDSISDDIDHLEEFIQAYCDAVEQLEDIEDEREEIANGGYVDMSQLDDIADELHDINQSLDDLQELLDDSSRAADRLYGAARIKQMEKNASLLQQEIDLLQQKKTAQDDIIAKEKQQLDEKTGGYIKYDEYGRITNYDSYINAREDQIREYEAALQEGGLSETEATLLQDEIDLLNEQIAAMEDYEQALEEKEDIQNQIEDAYYEWQDLNAEKLQYKLELQLDVNDRELAKIERAIKRLDGNFYSRAEALALMVGGGMNGDSKLGNYNKQLADLEAHYQEVKRQYEAGEISQAKYVEMTKELQAEIESTADAMAALQDQMDSYYKDTLAQARQELNFHISQLTHLTGILNHFKNTLTALGKSKDYEMMGTVLEGQVQALENEVKASKNAMQMWQKEADSIYQKYQQALSSGNQENADMYYNAYKEALSAANEAENKFYQQSAAWANALKALMENTLAGLAQDLENALTGGTSFDTITTQMKRASSLQEEYLTTTNKIYETTKLMRTAQQEIDKTTNSVAKQKLSQFITETKQMQNQNKLSKYELSIQQAKYDLLVAEIALEEARFAKSTVRLRRDSEGNFGYVYTADAQAIATAEQKFEDAQNKLYNIGLDGANKYTEKYQQTLAEMYNTLTSLQTKYLQGGFESEAEYNAAVLEAKEYYYEKLNQYSELYSVAINAESGTLTDTLVNNSGIVTDTLTKNSRIAADAWSTDFADMTTKTDQWMGAVTDYLSQVQIAFADWEVESQRIANETVGTDLTTLKNKVSDIVTESDNLTAAIGDENSGVIKAIYDEITAVSGLVDQYANLNGQLTQAIQNALDLSDALQQDIDQAGQDENPPGQYAPGEEESQKPGTVVPEGTDPLPEIELPEDPDENNPTNPGETTPTEPGETTPTEPGETTPEGTTKCTHAETTTQEVAPKCEKGGYKRVLCDSCNKMLENVTYPALGHDYKEGKCTRCGKEDPNWKKSKDVLNNKVEGVAAAIWMDGSDVSGWGTGNTRKSRLKEKGVSEAQDYINKHAENGDIYAAWHNKRSQLKQYYYGKFDTGGYTGAWGPEGKWAMLHEKEIVLNKEDTKNFLASLELLDNILSTIDLHAMNSQWASNLISPDVSSIGKEALEQMVNIEANFPNATDKYEIEEAFKDLVNLASQYANRK